MFQTFTGSSRKPRQVNLSGRRTTQTSQSKSKFGQSGHSASLLAAQQERARREAERRELEAAVKIQSFWRGRKEVCLTRESWRKQWDGMWAKRLGGPEEIKFATLKEAIEAIRLFLAFFVGNWDSKRWRSVAENEDDQDLHRLYLLVEGLAEGGKWLKELDRCCVKPMLDVQVIMPEPSYTMKKFIIAVCRVLSAVRQITPERLLLVTAILNLLAQLPMLAAISITENREGDATPAYTSSYSPFPSSTPLSSLSSSTEFPKDSTAFQEPVYYAALSDFVTQSTMRDVPDSSQLLLDAVLGPLRISASGLLSREEATRVYKAFARDFLTTPQLHLIFNNKDFEKLQRTIDFGLFHTSILEIDNIEGKGQEPLVKKRYQSSRQLSDVESRLWLLAHVIYLSSSASVRKATSYTDEVAISLVAASASGGYRGKYLQCLGVLLASVAEDIGRRIDIREDTEMRGSSNTDPVDLTLDNDDVDGDANNEDDDEAKSRRRTPLAKFVREQVLSLIQQSSVASILSHTPSFSYSESRYHDREKEEDAKALASYALTLLLVFARQRQEIRMWLSLASTSDGVPSVKFLWDAAKRSNLFRGVSMDTKAAVESLKRQKNRVDRPSPASTSAVPPVGNRWQQQQLQERAKSLVEADEIIRSEDSQWGVILLFFELYSFLLIVMDDEEFFSGGKTAFGVTPSAEENRTKASVLPLKDVRDLTVFLKNLAFAMYWNSTEIMGEDKSKGIVGEIFFNTKGKEKDGKNSGDLDIAGVKGMGFTYIKDLVTGLLRMIYLRDSRRKFLPNNHWLMTTRFDMEGFIPAVVAEEENRHKLEEEDDDNDEPEPSDVGHSTYTLYPNRLRRTQQQHQRNNYLAAVAPRLEILQHLPFFIPFSTRVQIFREFVTVDQTRRRGGSVDPDSWRSMIFARARDEDSRRILSKHHATIRRESVFGDAFAEFYELGEGLKEPIQITFVDQFGAQEAGIDGGGVTKEFLTSVVKEAFVPERYNLFRENNQHMLYPNPTAVEEIKVALRSEPHDVIQRNVLHRLRSYEFLGRILGKCLYEGILVDINFAPVFLMQWSNAGASKNKRDWGYRPGINDLRDLDEELYQGLITLKNYTGDVEEDFGLNFTITSSFEIVGKTETITEELILGGSNMPVTNSNRLHYIHLVSKYRLLQQPRLQISWFLQGLGSIINPSWLSMFNQSELQTLVGGGDAPIDVDDLRANAIYGGLYVIGDDEMEHPTVQFFWQVMKEDLSDEERRKVLKFVTSVSRAPLLGFGNLHPRFSIRDGGDDQTRLPSASTCVNLLKLPRYKDRETLREKLLYAVNAGAGFDLS